MPKFYVTFGQQYAHGRHPLFPDAHPDGYVVIHAADEGAARRKAGDLFGPAWAFMYGEDEWEPGHYPMGALAEVTA